MRSKITIVSLVALLAFFAIALPAKADDNKNLTKITGTLTAMSGTSVPATLTVTVGATTYTVEVSTSTHIVRRFNASSDLAEFLIGDILEVRGTITNQSANIMTAEKIRNISVQRSGGTFNGTITALDCTNNTLIYKPNSRVQQTVYLSTNTKIIRGGEKIKCADLTVNEQAKIIGLWRPTSQRIDADRIIVKMQTIAGTVSAIGLTDGGLPATLTVTHKHGRIWTVNVTSATKLYRRYMGTATIDEFAVGDKIEARGTLAADKMINAKIVRNNSVEITNRDFKSRIKSINTEAKSFTMTISRKDGIFDITVTTTDATKFLRDDKVASFSDLSVGEKIKVLGTYDSTAKTLAAKRVLLDD